MWRREFGYRNAEREMRRERPGRRYDSGFRYDAGFRGGPPRGYGHDYWWIGEDAMPRQPSGYDQGYRGFSRRTRPRFSPVGGMHPAVGGWTMAGNVPPPLRDYHHFSDWTHWF